MNDRKRISDELRPYVDREEGEALDRIAWRLEETDPEPPSAAFRSELRSHLVELQGRQIRTVWRPRSLRLAVASYVGSGLALLAIAALGVAGSGPLA